MSRFIIGQRENENIIPSSIPNKENYYDALSEIKQSWTGRMDANITNTFVLEAVQLIVNAIVLYEKGYFDCAYYSLRQTIELSTTMVYLSDIPDDERSMRLHDWRSSINKFPMDSQMKKYLIDKGTIFSDMYVKMKSYYDMLDEYYKRLNKPVHKQGFKYFYVSRNHPLSLKNKEEKDKTRLREFEDYLIKCIGAIAVMRLSIDPFPILLMDDEMYSRTFDTLTEPFSDEFVQKYIGNDVVEMYKLTEVYSNHYEYFITEEKKLPSVVNIVKEQYIDRAKSDEIMSQLHLLSSIDKYAVLLSLVSNNIATIHTHGGLRMYFTDTHSDRKSMSFNSQDFDLFAASEQAHNIPYDEAFISVVRIEDEMFFVEHNGLLSREIIDKLESIK